MSSRVYLAVDMGASSGRHVAGAFDGEQMSLSEVHRFENGPALAAGRMHWDFLMQWSNICEGMRAAATKHGDAIVSVGVDTWGVDFALLGRGDELLGNPYHYRDRHTDGILEKAFEIVSREEIFAQTGLQFMQFNTLFQLLAMRRAGSSMLDAAESLLMMPDLFHWLMTGEKVNELSDATTTQFYNPTTGGWATDLFDRFDLPTKILGSIRSPGTCLGPLTSAVAADTGLSSVRVVLPGSHDTASAVMAVPTTGERSEKPDWCYISSGTWSLMGVEVPKPVINEQCRLLNFTNEGGVGNTIRLLKNIGGLWLVQECRRIWNQAGGNFSWNDLALMADGAPPLVSVINPDDPMLLAPADMPEAIRALCRKSNQPIPKDEGSVIRSALEGLALKYRQVLGWLETLVGGRINTVHIVGGGTQNRQLCQMTADACGRAVVAGPVEATAIGNLMIQAVADGAVESIAEAREVIRRSFDVQHYEPGNRAAWDEAFERFVALQ